MRYTKPQITRVCQAVTSIQSMEGIGQQEGSSHFLTTNPAYQADE